MISTHTPLARRDKKSYTRGISSKFLLTRLLRGVTLVKVVLGLNFRISTHTPLARRDGAGSYTISLRLISTHTPLARRDKHDKNGQMLILISTHTPLARRDLLFPLL